MIEHKNETTAWCFPGQGSQQQGMGKDLFGRYQESIQEANDILGYSIVDLCLNDPNKQLGQTEFVQPALYVVNALHFFHHREENALPDFYAGHSLGEYNALHAAGSIDFATGLRLVQRRGELMAQTYDGGMAAVVGMQQNELHSKLSELGLSDTLDIANINSKSQIVVSGKLDAIRTLSREARADKFARVISLQVSAAFHSRFMRPVQEAFSSYLRKTTFGALQRPVIANVTALPAEQENIAQHMCDQICGSVRWWETMLYLRQCGVKRFHQLGPGRVLTNLWQDALKEDITPIINETKTFVSEQPETSRSPTIDSPSPRVHISTSKTSLEKQGAFGHDFCERHNLRYPYVSGSMYRGIASVELVSTMAKSGFLAFFGTGGLSLATVKDSLDDLKKRIPTTNPFGMNLLSTLFQPELEEHLIDLYLENEVRYVEASAFTKLTPALIRYRYHGAFFEGDHPTIPNHLFLKASRLEVIEQFLQPPRETLLNQLVVSGQLTAEEAAVARVVPVASEVCIEADSGGHTDAGVMLTILPSAVRLREKYQSGMATCSKTLIGAGGGLGTPEALAACFVLGAEFVLGGSIHQCTPQAGTSDIVKDMLAHSGIHDTGYAPAGDLFTTGARVQVLRHGTLFCARANFLYDVYRSHSGLTTLSAKTRDSVENYLGMDIEACWLSVREKMASHRREELTRIEQNEKAKMARVFKQYFSDSINSAISGDEKAKVNFQIHCGPAMGAFNSFAQNHGLTDWRKRDIDVVAMTLMERCYHHLSTYF